MVFILIVGVIFVKVHQSLVRFVNQFLQQTDESKRMIEYDSEWASHCVSDQADNLKKPHNSPNCGDRVVWSPQLQHPEQSFIKLEEALNLTLHNDIKAFFTVFWSDNLPAQASFGYCELLQVWNEEDFARLQENIIGHILMKQRLKQKVSVFFGVTEEDDVILTLDNTNGAVLLEQVGKPAKQQLAASLSEFIDTLTVQ